MADMSLLAQKMLHQLSGEGEDRAIELNHQTRRARVVKLNGLARLVGSKISSLEGEQNIYEAAQELLASGLLVERRNAEGKVVAVKPTPGAPSVEPVQLARNV